MKFLKKLLGQTPSPDNRLSRQSLDASLPASTDSVKVDVAERYYITMSQMQKAISHEDYAVAAQLVRENLTCIPGWVKATQSENRRFDVISIPSIEQGGRVLAVVGDEVGLAQMRGIIAQHPELLAWTERAALHEKDRLLCAHILEAIAASPGLLQTDLKQVPELTDSSTISLLVSFLEKAGKLARISCGRTHKLVLPGTPDFPVPVSKRPVASHRKEQDRPSFREVDLSTLEYVPLPRSPYQWEDDRLDRELPREIRATEEFEVQDAAWQITSVQKIPPNERLAKGFHVTHPCASGLLVIHDFGQSHTISPTAACASHFDRAGHRTAQASLLHDIYRHGVHPIGHGLIAVSGDSVLHAYDDALKLLFETSLVDAPEIIAIRKRFVIPDDELKKHILCVALSPDASRYLFTTVDEAWCVGSNGVGLWGAKLPMKDQWTKVEPSSKHFGTSDEVERALALVNLTLPMTPADLKHRYRTLAQKWHPDKNPGDPEAGRRMVALNAAVEVLTGIDASAVAHYAGGMVSQELHRSTIACGENTITLTTSIQVSEKYASDWIQVASFSGNSNAVYLAGSSGRVVHLDENGKGVRVYDIGAAPRMILDTGSYLYLVTDTRLYVLRDNALLGLTDIFKGDEVVLAKNGYGLRGKKRLRWYSADGAYAGSVVAKDPIRRVYFTDGVMTLETQRSRVIVKGGPDWWG